MSQNVPAAIKSRTQPFVCALAGLLSALTVTACATPPPPAPGPTAEDCVTLRLSSNGFHTNIAMPAALFPPDNPIRQHFPDDDWFLIGWGDSDYYIDPDPGIGQAIVAALWPTSSTLHVIAHHAPVEDTIWRGENVEFGVSRAGADRLVQDITATLSLDARGEPVILAEGRVAESSLFFAAEPSFHLFYMCNHWSAARLRDAGLPVQAWWSFTAPGLMNAVRNKAPVCE